MHTGTRLKLVGAMTVILKNGPPFQDKDKLKLDLMTMPVAVRVTTFARADHMSHYLFIGRVINA